MKRAKIKATRCEMAARRYCGDCLEIMDGSFKAGLARIGTEQFEKMVADVLKALPTCEKGGKP